MSDFSGSGGSQTQAVPVVVWGAVVCAAIMAFTRASAEVQCRQSSVKTLTYGSCGIDAQIECATAPTPPEPPSGGGGGGGEGGGHNGGGIFTFGGFNYVTRSGTVTVRPIQQS